jgi:hypothetical protein
MEPDFFFDTLPGCHLTEGRLAALRLLANTATLENAAPSCDYEEVEDWRQALLKAIDCLVNADAWGVYLWDVTDDPHNPLRFPVWITGGKVWENPLISASDHFGNLEDCPAIMDLVLKWGKEDLEAAGLNPSPRPAP